MSYTVREKTQHAADAVGVPALGVGQDGVYKALPLQAQEADAFSVDEINVPAAHAAAVVTFNAPGPNLVNVLSGVAFSYGGSGTLAGGLLTIADGAETVFQLDVPALGLYVVPFTPPRKGRPNRAMTITLADGGNSVQGRLNVLGHWIEPQAFVGQTNFSDEFESGLAPLFF